MKVIPIFYNRVMTAICESCKKNILDITCLYQFNFLLCSVTCRDRRDRMVVGFTTTCAISTYHH